MNIDKMRIYFGKIFSRNTSTNINNDKNMLVVRIPLSDIENFDVDRGLSMIDTLDKTELLVLLDSYVKEYVRLKKISYTTNLGTTYRKLKRKPLDKLTEPERCILEEYNEDIKNKSKKIDAIGNSIRKAYTKMINTKYNIPINKNEEKLSKILYNFDIKNDTELKLFRSTFLLDRVDASSKPLKKPKNKNNK